MTRESYQGKNHEILQPLPPPLLLSFGQTRVLVVAQQQKAHLIYYNSEHSSTEINTTGTVRFYSIYGGFYGMATTPSYKHPDADPLATFEWSKQDAPYTIPASPDGSLTRQAHIVEKVREGEEIVIPSLEAVWVPVVGGTHIDIKMGMEKDYYTLPIKIKGEEVYTVVNEHPIAFPEGEPVSIGRGTENADISLNHKRVSRRHALVVKIGNKLYICDQNSSWGTKVVHHESDTIEWYPQNFRVKQYGVSEIPSPEKRQDSHIIKPRFRGKPDESLFVVIDGHGEQSRHAFIKNHLSATLAEALDTHQPSKALEQTFLALHTHPLIEKYKGGATVTAAYIKGETLYMANVGDTRGVLYREGLARRLTLDHTPDDPGEQARIIYLGGIILNLNDPEVPTVIQNPILQTPELNPEGKRISGSLQVSRSLGNPDYAGLVIPNPTITETKVEAGDRLIIASDGLWHVCSDEEAYEVIKHIPDAKKASEALSRYAQEHGSDDDITVVVVDIA